MCIEYLFILLAYLNNINSYKSRKLFWNEINIFIVLIFVIKPFYTKSIKKTKQIVIDSLLQEKYKLKMIAKIEIYLYVLVKCIFIQSRLKNILTLKENMKQMIIFNNIY